jgi:ribosomal protein S27AE
MGETLICPRCGKPTIIKRDGVFRWRACRRSTTCGWTVFFAHGNDPRDKVAA